MSARGSSRTAGTSPDLRLVTAPTHDDAPARGRAIQGELFAGQDEAAPACGYRGTVASKVAGITYRQLDYWARRQIVEPSVTPSHGSGSRRLYSFKDVVILAVSKRLLDAGVNLQNVTAAIEFLKSRSIDQLAHVTIMCDGTTVHECTTSEQMVALLHSGSAMFAVSVASLWHQVSAALAQEDAVDVTTLPERGESAQAHTRDDIAQARRRRAARARQKTGTVSK